MPPPNDIHQNKSTEDRPSVEETLEIDAKLARPSRINLNYVSPYLHRSAVYARYRESRTSSTSSSTFSVTTRHEIPTIRKESSNSRASTDVTIPIYSTKSPHSRGKMLIINNILRGKFNYRAGAEIDERNLESVFRNIGFRIMKHNDLSEKEMMEKIENFRDEELADSPDVMVLVAMSHGSTSRGVVTNTSIQTVDEGSVDVEDIMQLFDNKRCKSMEGKPKIFIFQCCRGENYVEVDAGEVPRKAPLNDTLIAYSTLPGFVSFRNSISGSWYISTLCEVFDKYAHKHHVEDLLKLIDNKVSETFKKEKQITHFENRGFSKHCYLNPISSSK